jgi:2-methylcitrate synthase
MTKKADETVKNNLKAVPEIDNQPSPEVAPPPALEVIHRPGLEKVVAVRSTISCVDGNKGILEYRGINIADLVRYSSFEETIFLLLYNHLPNEREMMQFNTLIAKQRGLPASVRDAISNYPVGMHPINALQSAIILLSGEDFYADDVSSPQHNIRRCISLIAKAPTIIAAFERARHGEQPMPAVTKYTMAENFIFMLTGEPCPPEIGRFFDKLLILHAEHTMNASTFAARVIGSTHGSVYSAISGAVGALSGPLHGGANERVLRMLYSIGHPDNVDKFLDEMITTKTKIMGIGHRVYNVKDPRAVLIQDFMKNLLEIVPGEGRKNLYQTALKLEEKAKERLSHKGLHPNVDFYSGIVLDALRVPGDLFTPVFAISRVAGWCAHWLEQIGANRLFRPLQEYIGDHKRHYIPIEDR